MGLGHVDRESDTLELYIFNIIALIEVDGNGNIVHLALLLFWRSAL